MNPFVYDIPTRVYFGENQLGNLGPELARFGKRVLLAYGGGSIKKSGLYDRIVAEIKAAGLTLFEFSGIEPNPRIGSVSAGAEICKKEQIDVLLAVGGGSVLDCAKFIGAATFYDDDAWDILKGKVDVTRCLPLVTVLTLAATGSEMDTSGVISNLETKEKLGMGFDCMRPKVSFLDPTNTYSVSKYQTACGTADMLSHLFEVYFNLDQDLQLLDGVMETLMKTAMKYGPIAMQQPDNYEARANLMWTSSWAINGFVNGGKRQAWSCHPMEHELSAFYDITHGHGLAILTPRWMQYVLDETTAPKFYQYGVNVFGLDPALPQQVVAEDAIDKTARFLYDTLGLPDTLGAVGIDNKNFALMAQKACNGGVLHGFKPLAPRDVENIYNMCL